MLENFGGRIIIFYLLSLNPGCPLFSGLRVFPFYITESISGYQKISWWRSAYQNTRISDMYVLLIC